MEYLIPRFLIGRPGEVTPVARKVVNRAVRAKDWEAALEGVEWVPIDETPGQIMLKGPSPLIIGEHVVVYSVLDHVINATRRKERADWFRLQSQMLRDGMTSFWFCLCSLSDASWLIRYPPLESERAGFAADVLARMLPFWPKLCDLAPRYSWGIGLPPLPFTIWSCRFFGTLFDMGVPAERLPLKSRSPLDVGRFAERRLAEFRTRQAPSAPEKAPRAPE